MSVGKRKDLEPGASIRLTPGIGEEDLMPGGNPGDAARGIDDAGDVVFQNGSTGGYRGYIWMDEFEDFGPLPLYQLVVTDDPTWGENYNVPRAITNRDAETGFGQICGNTYGRSWLLTPFIPEN